MPKRKKWDNIYFRDLKFVRDKADNVNPNRSSTHVHTQAQRQAATPPCGPERLVSLQSSLGVKNFGFHRCLCYAQSYRPQLCKVLLFP